MTLTEFKRFADENNIVPISTEIYSQMISDSVKYAKMKEVLQEIRQEIADIPIPYDDKDTLEHQYGEGLIRDAVIEIIDKHIKEIEDADSN